jgi:hypothetical protein
MIELIGRSFSVGKLIKIYFGDVGEIIDIRGLNE